MASVEAGGVGSGGHHRPSNIVRPLNDLERALLAALDDEFIAASVIRARARLIAVRSDHSEALTLLAASQPVAVMRAACDELERRGLAERIEVAKISRWRRAGEKGLGES